MHNHGTALLDHREAARLSPVIGDGGWFERACLPVTMRIELPLSAELMVAALYSDKTGLNPDDLVTSEDVWGYAAIILAQEGMRAIERQAADIHDRELRGSRQTTPEWLAFLRRRVAEVTGGAA
jgi:hypothetical protein